MPIVPIGGVDLLRQMRTVRTRIVKSFCDAASLHVEGMRRVGGGASGFGEYVFHVDHDAAARPISNNRTIEAYDRNIDDYLRATPSVASTEFGGPGGWLGVYVDALQLNARRTGRAPRVLDLASGPRPRDGRMYRDLGFDVTVSDASPRSVEKLRESGFDAEQINMIEDDFGGPWDGISINGGVPHLSPDELAKVIAKAGSSLSAGGILAYNFKLADSSSNAGHRLIYNKGAEKDYYLRSAESLEPWELRYGLLPLPAPAAFSTGGTHLWASRILIKLVPGGEPLPGSGAGPRDH